MGYGWAAFYILRAATAICAILISTPAVVTFGLRTAHVGGQRASASLSLIRRAVAANSELEHFDVKRIDAVNAPNISSWKKKPVKKVNYTFVTILLSYLFFVAQQLLPNLPPETFV